MQTGGGYKSYKDFKYFSQFQPNLQVHAATSDYNQHQHYMHQQPSQTHQQYYPHQLNMRGTAQATGQMHYNTHQQYYRNDTGHQHSHMYYPMVNSSNMNFHMPENSQTGYTPMPQRSESTPVLTEPTKTELPKVPASPPTPPIKPAVDELSVEVKALKSQLLVMSDKVDKLHVQYSTLYNLITNRDEIMCRKLSNLIENAMSRVFRTCEDVQHQEEQQPQEQPYQQQQQLQQRPPQQYYQQQQPQHVQQQPQHLQQQPQQQKDQNKSSSHTLIKARAKIPTIALQKRNETTPGNRKKTQLQSSGDMKYDKSLYMKNLAMKYIDEEELQNLQADSSISTTNGTKYCDDDDDDEEEDVRKTNILDIQKLKKQSKFI